MSERPTTTPNPQPPNSQPPNSQPTDSQPTDPQPTDSQPTDPQPLVPLQYVVRCGTMRTLGVFDSPQKFAYGDIVVAETPRGSELGTVLCEATAAAVDAMTEPTEGAILRRATAADRDQSERMATMGDQDARACQNCIDALGLQMELIEVERILGGQKIVVYYLAESRVDFRQLVRDLARHFRTRIEMKQIGVRDEAKLLADYGDCGQPICCSRFLSKMPPVSMKMAKVQRATLDPNKISGRCGRLKCCLRYEFETYRELAAELPPVGSLVTTRDGNVTVKGVDILSGQLTVRTEDKRRILIDAGDVVTVIRSGEDPAKVKKRRRSSGPPAAGENRG